jgi:uncharacterized membrane protein
MAAAELAVDKMPFATDRIRPAPLLARAALGALVGWAAAERRRTSIATSAVIGALSAVGAAYAAYAARRALTQSAGVPDVIVAVVEDAVAMAGGAAATRAFAER